MVELLHFHIHAAQLALAQTSLPQAADCMGENLGVLIAHLLPGVGLLFQQPVAALALELRVGLLPRQHWLDRDNQRSSIEPCCLIMCARQV